MKMNPIAAPTMKTQTPIEFLQGFDKKPITMKRQTWSQVAIMLGYLPINADMFVDNMKLIARRLIEMRRGQNREVN